MCSRPRIPAREAPVNAGACSRFCGSADLAPRRRVHPGARRVPRHGQQAAATTKLHQAGAFTLQRSREVAEFFIDASGIIDAGSDLGTDGGAVLRAQAMHGHRDGTDVHPERGGDRVVFAIRGFTGEEGRERGELPGAASRLAFLAEQPQRAVEHRERPAPLEDALRRFARHGLGAEPQLGLREIDRERRLPATDLMIVYKLA